MGTIHLYEYSTEKKLSNAVLLNIVFTILLVWMNTRIHDRMILLCANMCPKSSISDIYIIDVVFCCVSFLYVLLRGFIMFAVWFLLNQGTRKPGNQGNQVTREPGNQG